MSGSPVRTHEANDPLAHPESTADVRARVADARARQGQRYQDTAWRLNADVPGPALRSRWPLAADALPRLDDQVYDGRLTRRGATRSLMPAPTCPGCAA